ncbi:hypothetical protein BBH99_13960 [Chryseobacterium contaminans]|uniref:Uncharacterized protein n=1 Tax=Chryseobacterium contaminans TaxID=1423959 RepID=A0A1M6XRL1_9FLAO|nr:hypothetical protein BBH99_13960 [Chryseobacterium contaminans]SHL08528.1 hypothetical protein SAMN05444407_102186 [Chryseobacterium contaminans]
MMRKNIKFFIVCMILLSVPCFVLGLEDSAFQQIYPSNNWVSYSINSLKYFLFWVLPNWWIFIIGGAVVLTLLFVLFKKIKTYFLNKN